MSRVVRAALRVAHGQPRPRPTSWFPALGSSRTPACSWRAFSTAKSDHQAASAPSSVAEAGRETLVVDVQVDTAIAADVQGKDVSIEDEKLKDEHTVNTLIQGYGNYCFEVNDVMMDGSIMCLPNITLLFKPTTWEEVTVESLHLLKYMRPRPDIVVFGTGVDIRHLNKEQAEFLQSLGIAWECLQTRNAVSTFNILCNEDRYVVGIILGVPVADDEFPEMLTKDPYFVADRK